MGKTPLLTLRLIARHGDKTALTDDQRALLHRLWAERSTMDSHDPIAERSPYHPAFRSPWWKPLH